MIKIIDDWYITGDSYPTNYTVRRGDGKKGKNNKWIDKPKSHFNSLAGAVKEIRRLNYSRTLRKQRGNARDRFGHYHRGRRPLRKTHGKDWSMTTCDTCPLRNGCYERRGLCNAYLQYMERVERTRRQIEQLNENNTALAVRTVPADKGGVQEAGDRRGKVYQSPAKRLQAKAGADPEAAAEAESVPEAAKVEGNGQA